MKCPEFLDQLDDLARGRLGGEAERAAREHLASCPSCRQAERGLSALLSAARALPSSVEPPRDLWKGIQAGIRAQKAERRPARVLPFNAARFGVAPDGAAPDIAAPREGRTAKARLIARLSVAAAVLAIGIGASLALPALLRDGGRESFGYRARPVPAAFGLSPGLAESQAALESARAELYAALEARRGSLGKETAAVLRKNLRIIDEAVDEIGKALERDPGNEELSGFLFSAYENELRVLSQAASMKGSI